MKKNIFNGIIILVGLILVLAPFNLVEAQTQEESTTQTTQAKEYKLLAPLPNAQGGKLDTFNPASQDGENSKLGEYLNIMFRLFIGICAVLAVIMIVMGGIEYMTSELVSSKEAGRKRISGAIFGLLLALGAYTILNTINSDLLNTDLKMKKATVNVEITDFEVSEAQSIDGTSGAKVSFKGEACPAATAAQAATGVDRALILSIFKQESSGGLYVGGCSSDGSPNTRGQTANMFPGDEERLKMILAVIGKTPPVNVSCAGAGGHGGAMGGMQILPSTWLENGGAGKDPWNTEDAMLIAAAYLRNTRDPYQAACKYFGKCSFDGVDYAKQVVDRMDSINKQINEKGC